MFLSPLNCVITWIDDIEKESFNFEEPGWRRERRIIVTSDHTNMAKRFYYFQCIIVI